MKRDEFEGLPVAGARTARSARSVVRAGLLGVLCAVLAGATPAIGQETSGARALDPAAWGPIMDYRIGPSDVLTIRVRRNEDLNQTVTVRPDGKLSLALLGDVVAAGLTPAELQSEIEAALKEYVNIVAGEVTVIVDAVHSYRVSVLGEVRQPGRFEFQIRVSVLDALAQAGGLTEFAARSKIQIFRTYRGQNEKLEFDYDQLVKSQGTAAWVPVLPGDIILVP